MKKLCIPLFIALIYSAPSVIAQTTNEWGYYTGTIQTEWLPDGRRMKILKDFSYIGPTQAEWHVPQAAIVDGASIPQAFWSIIGGPFEDNTGTLLLCMMSLAMRKHIDGRTFTGCSIRQCVVAECQLCRQK